MKPAMIAQQLLPVFLCVTGIALSKAEAQRSEQPKHEISRAPRRELPDIRDLITVRGNENRGGDGIPVGNELRLRDLVDPTLCDWDTADRILGSSTTDYLQIIERLARTDWYLAFALDREVRTMSVCQTKFLRNIWTEDSLWYSVHVPFALPNKRQLAIFDFETDELFLDKDSRQVLRAADFPYLLLHEGSHKLISTAKPRYYMRLRSFINDISKVVGNTLSREKFEFSNEHNGLMVSKASTLRNQMERQILFAVADPEERARMLRASNSPAELLILDSKQAKVAIELLPADAEKIRALANNPFEAAVLPICLNEERDLMERIQRSVDSLYPDQFDFASECLNLPEVQEDPGYAARLVVMSHAPKIVTAFLRELTGKSLVLTSSGRVRGTEPYRWLALKVDDKQSDGSVDTSSLRQLEAPVRFGPVPETEFALERRTRLFFNALSVMIRWMRTSEINAAFSTSAVNQALVLTPQDLTVLNQLSPTRKTILAVTYDRIVESFGEAVKKELATKFHADRSPSIKASIDLVNSIFQTAAQDVHTQLAPFQAQVERNGTQR